MNLENLFTTRGVRPDRVWGCWEHEMVESRPICNESAALAERERPIVALPPSLICDLGALVAEYEPEASSASAVVGALLECLGDFLEVSFTEEGADREEGLP